MKIYDIPTSSNEQEITFKRVDGVELKLYFLPPTKKVYDKAPIYFMFGGGGWARQHNKSMWKYFSCLSTEILRENGFAVASADYRTTETSQVTMPEIIGDCFDSVLYTAHFADVFGIDKNKFAFSGHSAGGHLALMMAYAPSEKFNCGYPFENESFGTLAAAPLAPITQFYEIDGVDPILFPPTPFEGGVTREVLELSSPYTFVKEGGPATMLVAGTHDHLVNYRATEQFYNKLLDCKIPAELVLSQNGGHCFEERVEGVTPSPDYDGIQRIVADFILKTAQNQNDK